MRNSEDKIIRKRKHERGTILTVAIIVVVAMLIMTIPFLVRLSGQWRTTEKSYRSQAAFQLAEAGIDKMMWYLDPWAIVPLNDTEAMQYSTDGTNDIYNISGIKTSDNRVIGNTQMVLTPSYGTDPQRRILDSTGIVTFIAGNTVNRKVRVILEGTYGSVFDLGFFVDDHFDIRNNFLVDSYNSKDGAYGGSNMNRTNVYFGTNSYYNDGSISIASGGPSSQIYGTMMAGGTAAEEYAQAPNTNPPPDPAILDDVISVPTEDVFMAEQPRALMKQEFELPPVDVYNLPPKDILGELQSVGDWFTADYLDLDTTYNSETPPAEYPVRLQRQPNAGDLADPIYNQGAFTIGKGGAATMTESDNGVYSSFVMNRGSTLTIQGDVTLYVTGLFGTGTAGEFYMNGSSINLDPNYPGGSSLTLILGDTSFYIENNTNINAPDNVPGIPANCVILGTEQFRPPDYADSYARGTVGVMDWENNGIIAAAIYAPRSAMLTTQGRTNIDLYGACLAYSMDYKNNMNFHYDEALGETGGPPGGFLTWKVVNWQELVGE